MCSKHSGEIPPTTATEFPWENCPTAHTAEDSLPAGWKHISDGIHQLGIEGLRRLHQGSRGGGVQYRPHLLQPTLPLFTALCHCDAQEQCLFHRKQSGNSEFN